MQTAPIGAQILQDSLQQNSPTPQQAFRQGIVHSHWHVAGLNVWFGGHVTHVLVATQHPSPAVGSQQT